MSCPESLDINRILSNKVIFLFKFYLEGFKRLLIKYIKCGVLCSKEKQFNFDSDQRRLSLFSLVINPLLLSYTPKYYDK